jgi:hypothetical protein
MMRFLAAATCVMILFDPLPARTESPAQVVSTAGERLVASDAAAFDRMGHTVSLAGHRVVVGAFGADEFAEDGGAVYVYENSAGVWFEAAKLAASDAAVGDSFGYLVAGDESRIVVGAYLDDNDAGEDAGAIYVFRYDDSLGEWIEEDKLTASDAAPFDRFGRFVAIDGERIVVGAYRNADEGDETGSAYVFAWDGNAQSWVEEDKLVAADASAGDRFGRFVAIDGDLVVVGADRQDESFPDSGAVYVFERQYGQPTPTWDEVARLKPHDPDQNQRFGVFVDVDGDSVVVGADLDDEAAENAGAVYVFERTIPGENVWQERVKLRSDDADAWDRFGVSVALDGDRLLIGASRDDEQATDAGAFYLFSFESGVWQQKSKLTAGDGSAGDSLGFSVALGTYAVAGAEMLDVSEPGGTLIDAGGAYVLDLPLFTNGFEGGDSTAWDAVVGDS